MWRVYLSCTLLLTPALPLTDLGWGAARRLWPLSGRARTHTTHTITSFSVILIRDYKSGLWCGRTCAPPSLTSSKKAFRAFLYIHLISHIKASSCWMFWDAALEWALSVKPYNLYANAHKRNDYGPSSKSLSPNLCACIMYIYDATRHHQRRTLGVRSQLLNELLLRF